MTEFIEKYRLLKKKSDYRKLYLTNTVTVKLMNDFLKATNKDGIILAFITDYSKAFDAVDYEILITKLQPCFF